MYEPYETDIYTKCTTPQKGVEDRITARTIYNYLKSPFIVYCDKFVKEEEKDPISEFQKLLFEQGQEHEKNVIEKDYPEVETKEYETKEEGFGLLLEAMKKGEHTIAGLPLLYLQEGLEGRIDLLEKNTNSPSIFGEYHYVVKEIKLAKNIQRHHIYQTAFYNYLLGKIQDYTPENFILINRDHEEKEYQYNPEKLLEIIDDIKEIQNGKTVTPTYGKCEWPWETYNNKKAVETDDVSLVSGIGATTKEKLNEMGIKTVKDLADSTIEKLTEIKGIGPASAEKYQTNAKALAEDKCIPLGRCSFKENKTEIFLDLEGTGEQKGDEELTAIDYLIGVTVRNDGKTEYTPFLAHTLEGEEEMFKQFTKWLEKQSDYTIYHWHHYELNHLKRLSERYGIPEELKNKLFMNMRDLYKDAKKAYAYPTYGGGLKDVAKFMGYTWRHKDVNAMESIAIYFNYLKNPEKHKEEIQKVIDYNEDDCRATMVVKDWLLKNSS
ncbi:MAG: TM0106 family RecB-like putative nuclease [Candidatus Hydrothermarchaeales archaeon]